MELHKMVQNYLPANKEYPWENRKDMKRAEQLLWEYSGGGRFELDKLMRRMIENDRRMEQKKAQDEERWRERENFNTEKLLKECLLLYNGYLQCEPKKNEFYRQRFFSEGGVVRCMQQYIGLWKNELPSATTLEIMEQILWGGSLQYLEYELRQLNGGMEIKEEPLYGTDNYKALLTSQGFAINVPDLERIRRINRQNLEEEEEKRKKRKIREEIHQCLLDKEVQNYMRKLGPEALNRVEAEEGSRIVEYFDTADKLGHIFEKLLKRLNVELHT